MNLHILRFESSGTRESPQVYINTSSLTNTHSHPLLSHTRPNSSLHENSTKSKNHEQTTRLIYSSSTCEFSSWWRSTATGWCNDTGRIHLELWGEACWGKCSSITWIDGHHRCDDGGNAGADGDDAYIVVCAIRARFGRTSWIWCLWSWRW